MMWIMIMMNDDRYIDISRKKTDACHEQFYILCKILYNCDAENDDDNDEFADKDDDDHDDDNDDDNIRMAFQDCVH